MGLDPPPEGRFDRKKAVEGVGREGEREGGREGMSVGVVRSLFFNCVA